VTEIRKQTEMLETDPHELRERLGEDFVRRRLDLEIYHSSLTFKAGRVWFHPDNLRKLRAFTPYVLRACGLYKRGRRNAVDVQRIEREVFFWNLPEAFDGYRICQLADLHIDSQEDDLLPVLLERLAGIDYDLCALTGDFRLLTHGPYNNAIDAMAKLMPALHQPCYGIYGNHDFIEFTPHLERLGVRMLVNEHVVIERDDARIYLAGVDDPHLYETDELPKALAGVPEDAFKILLSHSASLYAQAQAFNVAFMLSGHTHGGQTCLPGGFAMLNLGDHPRRMIKGPWRYHELQGYTSPGTGASFVPVRYNCPPEITIHTLRRGRKQD